IRGVSAAPPLTTTYIFDGGTWCGFRGWQTDLGNTLFFLGIPHLRPHAKMGAMRASKANSYVAAIDQGTTSTRCIIIDDTGAVVSVAAKEHEQIFPEQGWVEH